MDKNKPCSQETLICKENEQPFSSWVVEKEARETREALDTVLSTEHYSPFVSIMLAALADAGCAVKPDDHIAIEQCDTKSQVLGAFDPENNQIVLCQNKFVKMKSKRGRILSMDRLLSHELVHAFDYCRANVDFYTNPEHTMCTELRAATLSGECMFEHHKSNALFSGLKEFHQKCVQQTALRSFKVIYSDLSSKQANNILDKVFASCYNDVEPFDRIPFTTKQAEMSYKAYLTRNRYKVF